jgi:hypothetical protein
VQSSTLLLMACRGDIHVDHAIFADTGWEPAWVYEYLDWLKLKAGIAGIPLHTVSAGDLRTDALAGKTASWMPLFSVGANGKKQMLKRQCTRNYKIRPIRRKLRELCGGKPVDQLIGISLDEYRRMRTSDVKYITNVYPLVDRRITRAECLIWLERHGYLIPRKSSCIACPLRTRAEWKEIQADPVAWADALDFDENMREQRARTSGQQVFVHPSAVPLRDANIIRPDGIEQLELSDGCGVLCAADDA